MISILSSEGLAPSQAAPKSNKLSGPPEKSAEKSEEPSFSSLVSQGSSEEASEQNQSDPKSETNTTRASDRVLERTASEPELALAATDTLEPEFTKPAAPDAASVERDGKHQATADAQRAIAPTPSEPAAAETAATELKSDRTVVATGEQDEAIQTRQKPTAADSSITQTKPTPDLPEPRQPASPAATAEIQPEADPRAEITKRATHPNAEAAPQTPLASHRSGEGDEFVRISRAPDTVDQPVPEAKMPQFSDGADLGSNADKALQSTLKQAANTLTPTAGFSETLISVAPTQSVSATVATNGLTPIAPAIPVASPSELSAVILNAMKNGVEPQEQLIVQLDPPELGRVSIDFKFDAQGVQQITVTSENPEALKRLRELHFELTEALKDHGLSEKNMSFRQQAEGDSQPRWQMPELSGSGASQAPGDDTQILTQAARSNARLASPDRLDLTL